MKTYNSIICSNLIKIQIHLAFCFLVDSYQQKVLVDWIITCKWYYMYHTKKSTTVFAGVLQES